MKKRLLSLVIPAVILVGCQSGPSYLRRTVDDHQNTHYETDVWMTAVFTDVIPVYPIVGAFAAFGDWVVLNPVQFWGYDAWSKEGTSFTHMQPMKEHTPWFKK